jgi:hypothetical protein
LPLFPYPILETPKRVWRRFINVPNQAFSLAHQFLFIFKAAASVGFPIGIVFHVRPFSKRSVEVLHLSPKLSPTHHNHHHHLV